MVHMYICAVPILVMQMDPGARRDNRDPRLLHGGPAGVLAPSPGNDMAFYYKSVPVPIFKGLVRRGKSTTEAVSSKAKPQA
jgi:hypothetical protein